MVLIDTAWILHKNYNAMKLTTEVDGETKPTGHLYGSSRLLTSIMNNRDWTVVYVMDDVPQSKLEVMADYKSGRAKAGFSLGKAMDELECLVTPFRGVYSARSEGNEADDIMATMAVGLSKLGQEVIILSGDNDMLPMISEKVKIARKLTKNKIEYVEQEYIKDKYGVESTGIALYKVLMGCDSDGVPPMTGMNKKTAIKLIGKYNEDVDSFLGKEWKNEDLKEEALRNHELTRLRKDVEVRIIKRTPEEGLEVANKYKLKSIAGMLASLVTQTTGVGNGW